jgi:hypothetical protein
MITGSNHNNKKTLFNKSMVIQKTLLIFILWTAIHIISAHLYVYMCVPLSIRGIIMSPFMIDVPYCYATRWIMNKSVNSINVLWISIGNWCISYLISRKT